MLESELNGKEISGISRVHPATRTRSLCRDQHCALLKSALCRAAASANAFCAVRRGCKRSFADAGAVERDAAFIAQVAQREASVIFSCQRLKWDLSPAFAEQRDTELYDHLLT